MMREEGTYIVVVYGYFYYYAIEFAKFDL